MNIRRTVYVPVNMILINVVKKKSMLELYETHTEGGKVLKVYEPLIFWVLLSNVTNTGRNEKTQPIIILNIYRSDALFYQLSTV